MCAIPTKSSTFLNCPLVRSFRLPGTVTLSSSDVSPSLRSTRPMLSPLQPSLIRNQRLPFLTPATPLLSAALPFARISAAFLFPILAPTRAGSAFATVLFMTSSAEYVRALPSPTCPGSTIRSTAPSSVSKRCSTPTSPAFSCMCDAGSAFCYLPLQKLFNSL